MAEDLKIIIGADTSQLSNELMAAENELRKLQSSLKRMSDVKDIEKTQTSIRYLQETIRDLNIEAGNAAKQMNGALKQGANQATTAMTNLGRVVQDAPYGFIGIANNINPLLESFQRLKAETGSSGNALKALASSFMGGAGIGLVVSLATSLLVTFGDKLFDTANSTENFKQKLEDLKAELKSVTSNLNDFISVAESALKLNDINIVARFSDKTEQGTLQRQAKFITISEELVKATDARAAAWQNYLGVIKGAFKTEEDFNEAQKAALDVYNETIKKENELIDAREYQAAVNRAAVQEEKRANAERLKINSDKIYKAWIKGYEKLQKWFKSNKFTDEIMPWGEQIDVQVPTFQFNTEELNQAMRQGLIKDIKAFKLPDELLNQIGGAIGLENLSLEGLKAFWKKYSDMFAEGAAKAKDEQTKILFDLQANMLFSITEGLALAIVNGAEGLKSVFQGLFTMFGDAVIQLGKNAVVFSTAFQKLREVLSAGKATLGIAAGLALIAIGTIIKAGVSKLTPKFATGTTFAPGGLALVGERGPEIVNIPRGGQVIPAGRTSQIMGGMESVQVYGVLRGQDIYFSNKKYGQTYGRAT